MGMALVMPGLSEDSQGRHANNGKLAEHLGKSRPVAIDLILWIAILCLQLSVDGVYLEDFWAECFLSFVFS